MLLVLTKVLTDSPFSRYLSVLKAVDSVLSLCLSSGFVALLVRWYLSTKALLGGQARRVVGRASGMGKEKN